MSYYTCTFWHTTILSTPEDVPAVLSLAVAFTLALGATCFALGRMTSHDKCKKFLNLLIDDNEKAFRKQERAHQDALERVRREGVMEGLSEGRRLGEAEGRRLGEAEGRELGMTEAMTTIRGKVGAFLREHATLFAQDTEKTVVDSQVLGQGEDNQRPDPLADRRIL
jgi:hypothetical protein